jgi:hypothetical protein
MPSHHGRQALPKVTRSRLLRLVDEGMSYTKTAERVRCHRNTVFNTVKKRRLLAELGQAIDTDDSQDRTRRCPGCGGLVDMPCVLCAARHEKAREAASQPIPETQPVLKTKKKKPKPRPSIRAAFVVLADRTDKMPATPRYGYLALDKKMRPMLVENALKAARFGTFDAAKSFAIEAGIPAGWYRVVAG